jgi:uncharacterized protein YqjF (DUF2071 family)
MRKFLTAKWLDLVMANYAVDPSKLCEYVPEGLVLDFWNDECFVSIVAFKFYETRVLNLTIPFHTDFLEANLRFYVKRKMEDELRRGAVFIKEIVPRRAISLVARFAYGEPYETWEMQHSQTQKHLSYGWSKNSIENNIKIEIGKNTGVPSEDSLSSFIIEHYWGYTRRGSDRTDEYKVEHPKWELFEANQPEIKIDFTRTYSEKFTFLQNTEPKSVLLAKGSEIAVYKGERIQRKAGSR